MKIELDDLSRAQIHALLEEHLRDMRAQSPPESVHALDLDRLRRPEISFWSAWEGPLLLGCGALKELDASHGEVKSMRTPAALRAVEILDIILADEVGHVAIGNRWYRYLCAQRQLDPVATYAELAARYEAPALKGPFNLAARRAAGFDEAELARLGS